MQKSCLEVYWSKYQLKDTNNNLIDIDIHDTFKRVAKSLAEKEHDKDKWENKFLWTMENGGIPAGRILSNAGSEQYKPGTSLINCLVSENIEDSIDGILEAVKKSGISLSKGSGIGYCFSSLRPKGAYINGVGAYTSGSMSFMKIFDTMCFTINSAGGRRGAQMGTHFIFHPDIEEFITCKQKDGEFRQFNLSVLITNEFMSAVKNDLNWNLYFPIHKAEIGLVKDTKFRFFPFDDDNYIVDPENSEHKLCKVYKTVKAKDLWNLITKSTYEFSEPGILFYDHINNENNNWFCEIISATNPCFTGDTKVWTDQGLLPFKELAESGKSVYVVTEVEGKLNYRLMINPRKTQSNAKLVKVIFIDNSYVRCTPEHKFYLNDRTVVEAKNLKSGMVLLTMSYSSSNIIQYVEHLDITEDVYCGTVTDTGTFFIAIGNDNEGVLVSNCGEIPLPPNGSCLLGSINLTKFVKNPFTDNCKFDNDTFSDVISNLTRMMDNVVEKSGLGLISQIDEINEKRRHGMGIYGLGSALTMLKIKYGNPESLIFIEKIMKTIAEVNYIVGLNLAKEKGCAPIFNKKTKVNFKIKNKLESLSDIVAEDICKVYPDINFNMEYIPNKILWCISDYMLRFRDEFRNLWLELLRYGSRFTHAVTIAPTGTTSFIDNNASNGIEPSFLHQYKRNIIISGKKSKEQVDVYSYEFLLYRQLIDENASISDLPDYFITADSISTTDHVMMQAHAQVWVENSIAKCVAKGSKIITNKGILPIEMLGFARNIGKFANPLDGLKVLTENGNWENVTSHYYDGVKPTRKIHLSNGQIIECSLVHKLKTLNNEWKNASDFIVGDIVMSYSNNDLNYEGGNILPPGNIKEKDRLVTFPKNVTKEFALWAGMWLADGSITEHSVIFHNSDDNIINLWKQLTIKLFGRSSNIVKDKRNDVKSVNLNSNSVVLWVKELFGYNAESKKIPLELLNGNREEMEYLLYGISLDGYSNNNRTYVYDGKSKNIADSVFSICNFLGMNPRIGKKYTTPKYDYFCHSVYVYGFDLCLENHKKTKYLRDRKLLVEILEDVSDYKVKTSESSYYVWRYLNKTKNKWCEPATLDIIGMTYDNNKEVLKITKIEESENELYDIEVENTHSYLIDGIISHNTINCKTDIPFDEFQNVYDLAHENKLKGCATFRFNPKIFSGVLVDEKDLKNTKYKFTLENGETVILNGNDEVMYDGEIHNVANLSDSIKEGYYGKF
jgi:ribonucleotide reductase alpha subunit